MNDKTSKPVSAQMRAQILDAALTVFIANGYVGTSTDRLAAAASVSKQTLYRAFGNKEGIFTALILSVCEQVNDPFAPMIERMKTADGAASAVHLLAGEFSGLILSPQTQQLRRLVIAEAARFPALGRLYWESGFERMLGSIGQCLAVLDERGLLSVPSPPLAAEHFAGLLLWIPANRAMFLSNARVADAEQQATVVKAGTEAFLRAYAA